MSDGITIRRTYSVCPVCLRRIPAELKRSRGDGAGNASSSVLMVKECPEHGDFSAVVWKDKIRLEEWIAREAPLEEFASEECCCADPDEVCCESDNIAECCEGDDSCCAGETCCMGGTCCAILEVTGRCNLRCTYCFARGGDREDEPSFEELCKRIEDISRKAGGPLIQLSGGEPTLRDDLPELVRYAREAGCSYVQVNTNGIRLAEDEDYVRRLAKAGLDIAFLQFDGTDDEIYRALRGRDLLETKLCAIRNCDRYHIGVTLVPTVVRGINDRDIGNIIRKAVALFPAVRSVHFQPVTYLGRYPGSAAGDHYTLDELMYDMCDQTGIPMVSLLPSRCDHAMCEFHSTFMVNDRRQIVPMTDRSRDIRADRTSAEDNRNYVAEHWRRGSSGTENFELEHPDREIPLVAEEMDIMDLDEFADAMKNRTIKISAMAFQDPMNLDYERLDRCSLHVYDEGELKSFCLKYLDRETENRPLPSAE